MKVSHVGQTITFERTDFMEEVDRAVKDLDPPWRRFFDEGEVMLFVEDEWPQESAPGLVPIGQYSRHFGIATVTLFSATIVSGHVETGFTKLHDHLLDLLEHELAHHLGMTDEQITEAHHTRMSGKR